MPRLQVVGAGRAPHPRGHVLVAHPDAGPAHGPQVPPAEPLEAGAALGRGRVRRATPTPCAPGARASRRARWIAPGLSPTSAPRLLSKTTSTVAGEPPGDPRRRRRAQRPAHAVRCTATTARRRLTRRDRRPTDWMPSRSSGGSRRRRGACSAAWTIRSRAPVSRWAMRRDALRRASGWMPKPRSAAASRARDQLGAGRRRSRPAAPRRGRSATGAGRGSGCGRTGSRRPGGPGTRSRWPRSCSR